MRGHWGSIGGSIKGAHRDAPKAGQRDDREGTGRWTSSPEKGKASTFTCCFSLTREADVCGRVVGASYPRGKT